MKRSILLTPLLMLGACGGEAEQTAADDGDLVAKGEILGGSISDEMLPLESVTSQSPPLAGEEERLRQLSEDQSADQAAEADSEGEDAVVPAPDAAPAIPIAPGVPPISEPEG